MADPTTTSGRTCGRRRRRLPPRGCIRVRRIAGGTHLKLFVVGGTQPSERALRALDGLRAALGGDARVDVVDLHEAPEVAERERILATPLLVRVSPLPARRVAGDLSDTDRVLWTLGLGGGTA